MKNHRKEDCGFLTCDGCPLAIYCYSKDEQLSVKLIKNKEDSK